MDTASDYRTLAIDAISARTTVLSNAISKGLKGSFVRWVISNSEAACCLAMSRNDYPLVQLRKGFQVPEISKTVTNALGLLNCFSRSKPVFTASELARQLKLSRTSVLRLLVTLDAFGLIEKHPQGMGYRIGLRAFEIGSLFLAANPLSSLFTRAMEELVEKTQCTAYLAILDSDDVVILNYREGTLPIRFVWQVGDRLPCASTAVGKSILAHMSTEEIDRHLGKDKTLRGLTEKSRRTREELEKDLEKARKRGWGLAREESHAGLTAIGSAILDETGHPIAAISISFLDYPPSPKRLEHFAVIVQGVAQDISKKIVKYGDYGSGMALEPLTYSPAQDVKTRLPSAQRVRAR
jgi:DNA-binding IclR family transcriptional regulator